MCKYDTNIGASPLKELNIQRCLAHIQPSQAQIFQNIISKSVCLLGTTTGVIRVLKVKTAKLKCSMGRGGQYNYSAVASLCWCDLTMFSFFKGYKQLLTLFNLFLYFQKNFKCFLNCWDNKFLLYILVYEKQNKNDLQTQEKCRKNCTVGTVY